MRSFLRLVSASTLFLHCVQSRAAQPSLCELKMQSLALLGDLNKCNVVLFDLTATNQPFVKDETMQIGKEMRAEIDDFFEAHKTEREIRISDLVSRRLQLPASYAAVVSVFKAAGFEVYLSENNGFVKAKPGIVATINHYKSGFGRSHNIIICLNTDSVDAPTSVDSVDGAIFTSFI